jgi:hypothetical protein
MVQVRQEVLQDSLYTRPIPVFNKICYGWASLPVEVAGERRGIRIGQLQDLSNTTEAITAKNRA